MKKMKKTAAMLMAATVAVAMPMTAMAASITVENAIAGATYSAYRVFDYTKSADGEGFAYTIDASSNWLTFIQGRTNDFSLTPSVDHDFYVVEAKSTLDPQALANAMKSEVAKGEIEAEKTVTATGDSAEFTNISELGYYFIDTTSGTICSLTNSSDQVKAEEKNEKPTITKAITLEKGANDVNYTQYIGSDVTYKIVVNKGKGTTEAITVHDEMDSDLELKENTIVVKTGTNQLTEDEDYTVSTRCDDDDCTFEVVLAEDCVASLADNASVSIEYSATVKETAKSAEEMKNSAKVQYLNYTSEAAEVSVYEYEFNLRKIIKDSMTAEEPDGEQLDDAQFELRANGEALSFVEDRDNGELKGYHVVANGTSGSTTTILAGDVVIRGLRDGVYSLVEKKAPNGYNVLAEAVDVSIADANAERVVVENSKGAILPSTGGIGTTAFYAAGIVVMAGAVFFVVRSKKHE